MVVICAGTPNSLQFLGSEHPLSRRWLRWAVRPKDWVSDDLDAFTDGPIEHGAERGAGPRGCYWASALRDVCDTGSDLATAQGVDRNGVQRLEAAAR